ncbi:MAG: hypothetical protein AAGF49_13105, partial [Pseudomonadota bacterium]
RRTAADRLRSATDSPKTRSVRMAGSGRVAWLGEGGPNASEASAGRTASGFLMTRAKKRCANAEPENAHLINRLPILAERPLRCPQ